MTTKAYDEAVEQATVAQIFDPNVEAEAFVMLGYSAGLHDAVQALKESGAAIQLPNAVSLRLFNIMRDKLGALVQKSLTRAQSKLEEHGRA